MDEINKLLKVADTLLGPLGCPWSKQQTFFTLQPYILEEVHEVLEAIDSKDPAKIKEEIGDLLYEVIFVCKIAENLGHFTFNHVVLTLIEKLIRRHPHIFGDTKINTMEELEIMWESNKKKEKSHSKRKSSLDGIPATLPLLPRAQKLLHKMSKKKDFLPFTQDKIAEEDAAHQLLQLIYQMESSGLDAEGTLRRALASYEQAFRKEE